jgi:hypothetical protein
MTAHDADGAAPDEPVDEEPEEWKSSASWQQLLYAISYGQCTPFLGAGACARFLPLGTTLAQEWAAEFNYPFDDSNNLPRVAQYIALQQGQLLARHKLKSKFESKRPDFAHPDEPHRVVAELGLPVYITTNYDSSMMWALRKLGKNPIQRHCLWHKVHNDSPTKAPAAGSDNITPSPETPVVFHLHGLLKDVDSMVLTEDDYLNFLINVSKFDVIPPYIEATFITNNAFLFIGYSLEDMSFKVLFQRYAQEIVNSPGDRHVAVQLHSTVGLTEDRKKRQREFLQEKFKTQKVKIYWGTAHQFARRLRREWELFNAHQQ